ncbi:IS1595 family transposase [Rhizobacter sp. Root404]|uniref:IS1595 family transposase n=1 Tax=Rhizobacter sp. Root404 TaxID=1736528 RepID=UPI0006FC2FEE|nr:IS1595 family transposase [Rhizobacter sp. Root404]KQW38563.1 transposase [Rhizobacter sp. Root404]
MAEAILNQPHFQDPDAARDFLESVRWANGVVCPHCGVIDKFYKLVGAAHRPGLYKCSECREQFSVTVGTVFESSKIKLHIWLQACHLMSASKKGISSKQLERMLGVSYKTAWFMSHRIREAMNVAPSGQLGGSGSPVEVDETFWGNTGKQAKGARGGDHKMKIVSLVERNGEKRSYHVADVTAKTVAPILRAQIDKKARLMTDEAAIYTKVGREFAEHGVVSHGKGEYTRGDVTSNTVESSFAILKRGLYGTFHSVSEQHLQRYATEFDFRWNNRQALGVNDVQRTAKVLMNIEGKRLTYRA